MVNAGIFKVQKITYFFGCVEQNVLVLSSPLLC